jgi:hypothetical protein
VLELLISSLMGEYRGSSVRMVDNGQHFAIKKSLWLFFIAC